MNPLYKTLPAGHIVGDIGSRPDGAFLISSGRFLLSRRLGEAEVPIALFGPGDLALAESLFKDDTLNYRIMALDTVAGYEILSDSLSDLADSLPPWVKILLEDRLQEFRLHEHPARANISTLYGICNLLHAFLLGRETLPDGALRGPSRPILEELEKSRPASRELIQPVLQALSHVGLIDLRLGDPLAPQILMPDVQLFLGFLIFLQNAADLKEGLHENVFVINALELSHEAEILLDGMLMQEDLTARMAEPERAIVHLTLENLQQIYASNGGTAAQLDANHPCLRELEVLSAFTRVVDDQRLSVFLNLRNLLRLNIRRDPNASFVDLIDYLLDAMFRVHYHGIPEHSYRERL